MSDPLDIKGTIDTLSKVSDRLASISKDMSANQKAIDYLQSSIKELSAGRYTNANSLCAMRIGYHSDADTGSMVPISRSTKAIRARIKLHEAALEYLQALNAILYEEVVDLRERL